MTRNGIAERRRWARVPLRWVLRLHRPAAERRIAAETRDISSEGFYCIAPESFTPGENLECLIGLPAADGSPARSLSCRATVVRVDQLTDGRFGIGCRIEDYSVSAGAVQ